jgi:hypothetical protein
MFEGYNTTKAERAAIDRAHAMLSTFTRSEWELRNMTAQEAKGYGNRHDRVPAVAARGLLCQWFANGAAKPDAPLRDYFTMRPVAVQMYGHGARAAHEGKITPELARALADAIAAHDAAFDRMMHASKAALQAAAQ